jgi:5-methyltetrahydropteroyltriglutamate--homocysteine methyltransferase
MERHAVFADKPLDEFLAFVRLIVSALNRALVAVPLERVRLHFCWGNYEGPHDLDVDLGEIWPEIAKADVGAFMISMANPRHAHEVRYLADGAFPPGAILIPGVIDTTTNYVEHPEVVALRISEAAAGHCQSSFYTAILAREGRLLVIDFAHKSVSHRSRFRA